MLALAGWVPAARSREGAIDERQPPQALYRVLWSALYLVLAVAGVLWIGSREGAIGIDLFLDRDGWWLDVLLGLAAGGALVGLWAGARAAFPAAERVERALAEALGPLERSDALALAAVSGLAEEVFFRGAVQGSWGWPMATALFAILHVGPGRDFRYWTAYTAVAGLVLAGLVEWRANLLPAIVAHVLVNALGLARLARSGGEVPPAAAEE